MSLKRGLFRPTKKAAKNSQIALKPDFHPQLEVKMAHASVLLCFLARFSALGALSRNVAGNTLKRDLKWRPAGLVGWEIASQARLAPSVVSGLISRFCGRGCSEGFRGQGRAHFRDVFTQVKNLRQF